MALLPSRSQLIPASCPPYVTLPSFILVFWLNFAPPPLQVTHQVSTFSHHHGPPMFDCLVIKKCVVSIKGASSRLHVCFIWFSCHTHTDTHPPVNFLICWKAQFFFKCLTQRRSGWTVRARFNLVASKPVLPGCHLCLYNPPAPFFNALFSSLLPSVSSLPVPLSVSYLSQTDSQFLQTVTHTSF